MVLAKTPLIVMVGLYLSGGDPAAPEVWFTLLAATLTWATLYALNESADLEIETGQSADRTLKSALLALLAAIILASIFVSPQLAMIILAMVLVQLAYSLPGLRLKRYWWYVIATSGALNPLLRLECGVIWGHQALPLVCYLALVLVHLGGALQTRILRRERDRLLGYQIIPTDWKGISTIPMVTGILLVYGLCWQGTLPVVCVLFATAGLVFTIISQRITNMATLHKCWVIFAILSVVALIVMYR